MQRATVWSNGGRVSYARGTLVQGYLATATPPQDHHTAPEIGLLQGPRVGWGFHNKQIVYARNLKLKSDMSRPIKGRHTALTGRQSTCVNLRNPCRHRGSRAAGSHVLANGTRSVQVESSICCQLSALLPATPLHPCPPIPRTSTDPLLPPPPLRSLFFWSLEVTVLQVVWSRRLKKLAVDPGPQPPDPQPSTTNQVRDEFVIRAQRVEIDGRLTQRRAL